MTLTGKGYYIWNVKNCEQGDPERITAQARASKLTHVLIKIADGAFPYNVNLENGYDYARGAIKKLQSQNISVWGWQYIYGNYPIQEAEIAVRRAIELGVDGFVVNAEQEYEQSNKTLAADRYMSILRNNLGSTPIALSSFRYPFYHRSFPFGKFLERCDYNMPQVYWMKSHNNAGAQLQRCINEYRQIQPYRPIIPTGPTFKEHGWVPTQSEVLEFIQVAQKLNLPAVNFWYWEGCRRDLPAFWNLVGEYSYGTEDAAKSVPGQYIQALNNKDIEKVLDLYHHNAVHIRSGNAVLGKQAIREWMITLLDQYLEKSFSLLDETSERKVHNFRWQAKTRDGKCIEGRDTMGIIYNTIRYHYSFIEPV